MTYTWESLDGWSGIPAGGYTLKNLVLPPPVPAEAGQTYKLRLTARFTGSTSAAVADVALTAVGSPLSASLLGPSGDVIGDRDIVLDASRSQDPDDPQVRINSNSGTCVFMHSNWLYDGAHAAQVSIVGLVCSDNSARQGRSSFSNRGRP